MFRRLILPLLLLLSTALMVSNASAQSLIGSMGGASGMLAVNPRTNKIYNAANQSIVVHDGFSHAGINVALPAGVGPQAFAIDVIGNRLYVSRTDGQVSLIDGDSNAITTTLPLGGGALAIDRNTQRLYVIGGGGLAVADLDGNLITTVADAYGQLIAVNPVANRIYVADSNSHRLIAIDGASFATTSVSIDNPAALTLNPATGLLYAVDASTYKVYEINGQTLAMTELMTGDNPLALGLDPSRNTLYVCNSGTAIAAGSVTAINLTTQSSTTLAVGIRPRAIAIDADRQRVYVANAISGSVSVIDATIPAVLTSVSLGAGTQAGAITLNPLTNRIYAASTFAGSVAVIDGASYASTALAPSVNPGRFVADARNRRVAVIDFSQFLLVDADTGAVTPVSVGSGPTAVDFDAAWNRYYVVNAGGNSVSLVDASTLAVTTVATGALPQDVAADPPRNRAFVANYGAGSVSVVDAASATQVTVATAPQPQQVAVDTSSGDAFVIHANTAHISVIRNGTLALQTVALPVRATGLVINPQTRRVYATTLNTNKLYVIDGATLATTELTLLATTNRLAINRRRNLIYVSYGGADSRISILNGSTLGTTTVNLGSSVATAFAVDEQNDRVFVTSQNNFTTFALTVMRGPTHAMVTRSIASNSFVLAVDALSGQAYFGGTGLQTVRPEPRYTATPTTQISGPANARTSAATATFSFLASSHYAPSATTPLAVFFRTGDTPFQATSAQGGGVFTATSATLQAGTQNVVAFAIDALGATHVSGLSISAGAHTATPFPGAAAHQLISRVEVTSLPTTTQISTVTPSPVVVGQPYSVGVTVSAASGVPAGNVGISDGNGAQCMVALSGGSGSCNLVSTGAGPHSISAAYAGQGMYEPSAATAQTQPVNRAATTTQITAHSPDPSLRGEAIAVSAAVGVDAPGAGTPGGVIRISHASNVCDIVIPATSCSLTPAADGAITLRATYLGDVNFEGSGGSTTHQIDAQADLQITLDNPAVTAVPGTTISYIATARNLGPSAVSAATASVNLPTAFDVVSWTCSGSAGGSCETAGGNGPVLSLAALPEGSQIVFAISAHINPGAVGNVQVEASISATTLDPLGTNNTSNDSNALTPQSDIAVTLLAPHYLGSGQQEALGLQVFNAGPSNAPGVGVQLSFPSSSFASTSWTCQSSGGASCPADGSGNIAATLQLPAGAATQFLITASMRPDYEGPYALIASSTPPGGVVDPQPSNNSSSIDGTVDLYGDGFQ